MAESPGRESRANAVSDLAEFYLDHPVLIRCPRCGRRAVSAPLRSGAKGAGRSGSRRMVRRRLSCEHCGLTRELSYRYRIDSPVSGDPTPMDPHFREQLWLQAPCAGHVVWAYNLEHLEALVTDVRNAAAHSADGAASHGLLPRPKVPEWMVANARDVLDTLAAMRDRALGT